MLVSVILVIRNPGELLYRTINSILSQSYSVIELIVIDCLSTDGSLEYIDELNDKRIRLISEKDEGIYDAMNKGLDLAEGELVNFMNAGDYFVEDYAIEKVINSHSQEQSLLYSLKLAIGKNELYSTFFVKNVCHQTIFYNKNLTDFRYNLDFRLAADFEVLLFLISSRAYGAVKLVDSHVYYDTKGVSSVNRNERYREKIQIMRRFIYLSPRRYILTIVKLRIRLILNL
jgi:glycosyltransferase involved in cell wall biosynthesis